MLPISQIALIISIILNIYFIYKTTTLTMALALIQKGKKTSPII